MTRITKSRHRIFHKALYRWYAQHGRRELPWRNTGNPYHIYVSEIMLQQTQVKTVLERYYFPFLERFPTLRSIAEAPLDDVLKCWEGLGYYTRARNLHHAAIQCNGKLPEPVGELMALPGIGKNTAHAIAAFAFQQPVAVMEANLKRVLARIHALDDVSRETLLWEKAAELLDERHPFDYNQAMMDLGALVCTAKAPKCQACPASAICRGRDAPERYPPKKPKKQVPLRKKVIVVFYDCAQSPRMLSRHKARPAVAGGIDDCTQSPRRAENKPTRYYIVPRETTLLGGLWGFPEMEADEKEVIVYGKPYLLRKGEKLGNITQTYSHFRLDAEVWRLPYSGKMDRKHWKTWEEMQTLPLSNADRKVMKLLEKDGKA